MSQNIITRHGLVRSTVMISLIVIVLSTLVTAFILQLWGFELVFRNVVIGTIVPGVVAPPIIYYIGKLMIDLSTVELVLRERSVTLENALADVKKLSGLLPICASCKNIRDDQGYWNEIERYISQRSEATFTHGFCPPCIKALYPDTL